MRSGLIEKTVSRKVPELAWIEDGRPAVRRMGGGVKPDGETEGDRLVVQKRSDAQHVLERSQRTCLERSMLGSPLSMTRSCEDLCD